MFRTKEQENSFNNEKLELSKAKQQALKAINEFETGSLDENATNDKIIYFNETKHNFEAKWDVEVDSPDLDVVSKVKEQISLNEENQDEIIEQSESIEKIEPVEKVEPKQEKNFKQDNKQKDKQNQNAQSQKRKQELEIERQLIESVQNEKSQQPKEDKEPRVEKNINQNPRVEQNKVQSNSQKHFDNKINTKVENAENKQNNNKQTPDRVKSLEHDLHKAIIDREHMEDALRLASAYVAKTHTEKNAEGWFKEFIAQTYVNKEK